MTMLTMRAASTPSRRPVSNPLENEPKSTAICTPCDALGTLGGANRSVHPDHRSSALELGTKVALSRADTSSRYCNSARVRPRRHVTPQGRRSVGVRACEPGQRAPGATAFVARRPASVGRASPHRPAAARPERIPGPAHPRRPPPRAGRRSSPRSPVPSAWRRWRRSLSSRNDLPDPSTLGSLTFAQPTVIYDRTGTGRARDVPAREAPRRRATTKCPTSSSTRPPRPRTARSGRTAATTRRPSCRPPPSMPTVRATAARRRSRSSSSGPGCSPTARRPPAPIATCARRRRSSSRRA